MVTTSSSMGMKCCDLCEETDTVGGYTKTECGDPVCVCHTTRDTNAWTKRCTCHVFVIHGLCEHVATDRQRRDEKCTCKQLVPPYVHFKDCPTTPTPPPTQRSVKDLTMEEAQEIVASGQGAFIPAPPPTQWEEGLRQGHYGLQAGFVSEADHARLVDYISSLLTANTTQVIAEVERLIANYREHHEPKDCETLFMGCTECAGAMDLTALKEKLASITNHH